MTPGSAAARLGGRVALCCALLTGAALALLARGALGLCVAVLLGTAPVAAFAHRAGRRAGPRIEGRGLGAALAIGALGGLASLVAMALTAAAAGLVWGLADGYPQGRDFLWSYLGKPFFAVLLYGATVAALLGALGGLLIALLLRRGRAGGTVNRPGPPAGTTR